jgi:hypothetical protein
VFGWLTNLFDRFAAWVYRRGQGAVDSKMRAHDERVAAARGVRDGIAEAMMHANLDRERGSPDEQDHAIRAATRAGTLAQELDDELARKMIADWKARFDAIPKGWMKVPSYSTAPPGYPEPDWSTLKEAARVAEERVGGVLRELLAEDK